MYIKYNINRKSFNTSIRYFKINVHFDERVWVHAGA
jgi:hypothetical protein